MSIKLSPIQQIIVDALACSPETAQDLTQIWMHMCGNSYFAGGKANHTMWKKVLLDQLFLLERAGVVGQTVSPGTPIDLREVKLRAYNDDTLWYSVKAVEDLIAAEKASKPKQLGATHA